MKTDHYMIAMGNRAIIAATAVSLMLLVIFSVKPAMANPFFMFHRVDPVPGTTPPMITISSPQDGAVYSSDTVAISFNVSRPLLGNCETALIDITYKLDLGTFQAFTIWRGGSASNGWAIPEYSTNVTSIPLSAGIHTLTISAEGVVYVEGLDIFFITGSSTVRFATGIESSEINIISTQAPTSTSTAAPTAHSSRSPAPLAQVTTAYPPEITNETAAPQSPQPNQSPIPQQSATILEFPATSLTIAFLLAAATVSVVTLGKRRT